MRPANVKHWKETQLPDTSTYPNDPEPLGIRSPLSEPLGLWRLGINHLVLPPGRRASWPHAELSEEEFVYVLEGTPDLWQDGQVSRLEPGDAVGWPSGTGVAHTVINNTEREVRLLVVGEPSRDRYQVHYPLHPKRNEAIKEHWWKDAPRRELGPHDGEPDALRSKANSGAR